MRSRPPAIGIPFRTSQTNGIKIGVLLAEVVRAASCFAIANMLKNSYVSHVQHPSICHNCAQQNLDVAY
jgi:hypothetical protein